MAEQYIDGKAINKPIYRLDYKEKIAGTSAYVSDSQLANMLFAITLRSPVAKGVLKQIKFPELPSGYYSVTAADIPGVNDLKMIVADQPVFAAQEVSYIGEPLALLVGGELAVLYELAEQTVIDIEEQTAATDLQRAIKLLETGNKAKVLAQYKFGISEEDFSRAGKQAHQVINDSFFSGYQEHVYLEPQAMLAYYREQELVVQGSMQCPYYVQKALLHTLDMTEEQLRVIQSPTGGGFGGKEDYPSMLACHVALATLKTKQPVILIYDRAEDMQFTTKRHPAQIYYTTALDQAGNILAMDVKIYLDGGANTGLSPVVLQRALINSAGVYKIPNFRATGYVLQTNTVPNGAFRGFGAPQSIAGIESHLQHISKLYKLEELDYKMKYLVRQGDPTITKGLFRDKILMEHIITETCEMANYQQKNAQYRTQNQGKVRYKRGLGTALFLHGCGFTGSGERDYIRAVVRLLKTEDDNVHIKIANVDMGQGLITTMSKIVAATMQIDLARVHYPYPDTREVPDSGPTVASRTTMIVGKLLERAALKLKKSWQAGKVQEVFEQYVHEEMIPWDEKTFTGDAYPAYSWGVNIAEVEVDTLTGQVKLLNVYAGYDIGKAIDDLIIKGQIDGGLAQGLAYGYLETMTTKNGAIQQKSISDYGPPTSVDAVSIYSKLFDNPYASGPYGAKGAGELTLIGGAPAVKAAIEEALQTSFTEIPVRPELIIAALNQADQLHHIHQTNNTKPTKAGEQND